MERATNLRDAVKSYEVAVSEASRARAEQLHAALRDHDAAMSHATEAFEAAFSEAEELSPGVFGEARQPEAETAEPPDEDSQSEAAQHR